MRWVSPPSWKAVVFGALVVVFGGLILAGGFILSGVYNVAASSSHFDITNAVIRLTLRRSIATHSIGVEVPDFSDEGLARLGARHFELGCAPCHASPASTQNPIAAEMYPSAPRLSGAVEHWEMEELFWIVKNGLKFTGMPAWPGVERDEEVWALVAFLQRLPGMEAEEYAALAAVGEEESGGADEFDFGQDAGDTTAMCDACHGGADAAPVAALVPPLAGQKQLYLHRALTEYARNRRQSGMMEPIAAELGAEAINRLARFYARRDDAQLAAAPDDFDAEAVRRGEAIARNGVPDDEIPACLACHSAGTSGQFPRLEGLPAKYIATQLSLFSEGVRAETTYAAIMAPIAQRLSRQQIGDVAAYFASRPMIGDADRGAEPEAAR